MSDGEFCDLDEVARFGCPWHGLIRGFTMELPGGIVKSIKGVTPEMGDRYEIQIPGIPAVDTPTADAGQGMTWLNYAVMYGTNHVLYGQQLGNMRWVWIDGANLPYIVELSVTTTVLSVSVQRFGLLDGSTPLSPVSVSVSLASPSVSGVGNRVEVSDIDAQGRNVVVHWRAAGGQDAIASLVLSGFGSAPSLSATMRASFYGVDAGGYGGDKLISNNVSVPSGYVKDKPWWVFNNTNVFFGPYETQVEAIAVAAGRPTSEGALVIQRPYPSSRLTTLYTKIVGGTVRNGIYEHVIFRSETTRDVVSDTVNLIPSMINGILHWGGRHAYSDGYAAPYWYGIDYAVVEEADSGFWEIEVCGNAERTAVSAANRYLYSGADQLVTASWVLQKVHIGSWVFPGLADPVANPRCSTLFAGSVSGFRMANRVFGVAYNAWPEYNAWGRVPLIRAPGVGIDRTAAMDSDPGKFATHNERTGELVFDSVYSVCFF